MPDLHYNEKTFETYDHSEKLSRGIEFTIDYDGRWYAHGGSDPGPIKRKAIAALFGGAGKGFMAGKGLLKEGENYWLKSPDGKYGVEVEDVPFVVKRFEIRNRGQDNQEIDFFTDFDEAVPLDKDHEILLRPEPRHQVDVLYLHVRNNLWARLDRAVNSDIIQNLVESVSDTSGDENYVLHSYGHIFKIAEHKERQE